MAENDDWSFPHFGWGDGGRPAWMVGSGSNGEIKYFLAEDAVSVDSRWREVTETEFDIALKPWRESMKRRGLYPESDHG